MVLHSPAPASYLLGRDGAHVKVRIPTPLFSYTSNRAQVEATGATVAELTSDLDRQFPGLRFRVIDEQNQIRPHVKFFINQTQVWDMATPLAPTDEVAIVQAFSGG